MGGGGGGGKKKKKKTKKKSTHIKLFLCFLKGPACGESQVELRARIVGGSNSKKGWWPWQVGIHKLDNSGNSYNLYVC